MKKIKGKIFLITLIISFSAFLAVGQTPSNDTPNQLKEGSRPNIDETFDLSIDLRRITRENFEASTAVSTDGNQRVNLQVGVGLTAGRIDVLLKNVQGRVRFRGSLDRILALFDNRPRAGTATAP